MFNRKLFKSNAKMMLKRYYWKAFLAVLIITGGTALISLLSIDYNPYYFFKYYITALIRGFSGDQSGAQQALQMAMNSQLPSEFTGFMNAVNAAVSIVIAPVLTISLSRFFLFSRENKASLKELINPFKKNFGHNLGTMLLRNLYIWLWTFVPMMASMLIAIIPIVLLINNMGSDASFLSVLLVYAVCFASIIPLMIKSMEYSMLPHILAENTKMTYKRAFQLTKAMTNGYKWKLFVLGLSFIGWNYLAVLIPFGAYFLAPYIYATNAEVYTFLKARALESGVAVAADFPGLRDIPAAQPTEALPVEEAADAAESAVVEEIEAEASVPELTAVPENAGVLEIDAVPQIESVPEIESVPQVESAPEIEAVPVIEAAPETDEISEIKSEPELNTSETAE